MAAKAERGGTLGVAKIGYLNVKEDIDGREVSTIAVDRERAPFVVMAFKMYATGQHSYKAIRDALVKAGFKSKPTKKYPAGCAVSVDKIFDILSDRYYLGIVTYKGQEYDGRHKPLVSQELFDRVQQVRERQRGRGTRKRVHDHHLKGALWCARCKKRLILEPARSHTGVVYFYLRCRSRQDHACDLPRIPLPMMETEIARHITTLAITADEANQLRERMNEATTAGQASTAQMRRALKTEHQRLERLEDQYMALVGNPDWPQDKLTSKMRDLAIDKAAIHARLADPAASYRQASDDAKRTSSTPASK